MKNDLRDKFILPKKGLLVKKLLDFFEDDLLNHEKFPEEYLIFLKEVFSRAGFFEDKKSWKILHLLTTENLDERQFHELSFTLFEHFHLYNEYMLCDMSCDFIARTCRPEYALDLFGKMIQQDMDDIHRQSIGVGLNILLAHRCQDEVCKQKTHELVNSLIN